MRQIINLQLGQCGNNVGLPFLQAITQEHGLDNEGNYIGTNDYQRQHISVYFNEIETDKYNARTILADLQPGVIDYIIGTPQAQIYNPDNFIVDTGSAGNSWARGYNDKGNQIIERLMDAVRREADACDHMEGFQLVHSMGGGTGSGLGSRVIERLSDEYNGKMTQSFSVYPSEKVSDCLVEPYNAVFMQQRLIQHINLTNVIQNQALFRICQKKLKLEKIAYRNINQILGRAMGDLTCGLRFPGQINSSLRKQAVNMVVFPRLHFLINSLAPLASPEDNTRNGSVQELLAELWSAPHFLTSSKPKEGRYMTAAVVFRGKVASGQAEKQLNLLRKKRRNNKCFVDWIEDSFQSSYCDVASPGHPVSAVFTGNSNSVKSVFKKISENFGLLFRKKAFLHWYTSEGVDLMEFNEAESNMNDLISQYQWESCCNCGHEEYDEGEYQ